MIEDIKAFGKWLYDWITVLTASVVGGLSSVFELLDLIGAVDLTAFMPAEYAAKIITVVAIAKGLYAWYTKRPDPDTTDYGG